ncbi:MAG: hypothetical protein WAT39_14030 [Planctomycetota bacterium]
MSSLPGGVRLAAPLGQGEALRRWTRLARRGELPHGLLVTGARGGGKSTVIDWLTGALLCPSELDQDGPCGVCRTCVQVARGDHPDVHRLDRAQDKQDQKEWKKSFYVIKVDQVRQVQERLTRHAFAGRARVLVITDADTLEEAGQNALLKTLEEPGASTWLLLEAGRPEQLLPTVHSRAQRLPVLPLSDPVIQEQLAARMPQHRQRFAKAVAVARGSLGLALAACTEQVVQLHDLVLELVAQPDRLRPIATARAVLEGAGERRLAIAQARTFLSLLRAELSRARDGLAAAGGGAYPAEAEPWTTWLELTLAADRDLDLMIPPEQVLTACLLSFTG